MTLTELFAAIAAAIRSKDGTTAAIPATTFPERIMAISGGGGGSGGPFAKVSVFEGPDGEIINVPVTISASVSVSSKKYPVYTSACNETTGSTTLTGTINAKAGAWVLATVTTRSAATYPDGWTLLHESAYVTTGSTNQKMAFLCKYVDAAETVSFTVNQAVSGRMYLNLIAVTGCQGFRYHSGSEKRFTTAAASFTVTKPDYDYVFWGCSAPTWTTGLWSCSQISASAIGLGSSVASRQCNFLDDGDPTERVFVANAGSSGTVAIIDCVEVLV